MTTAAFATTVLSAIAVTRCFYYLSAALWTGLAANLSWLDLSANELFCRCDP